MENIDIKSIIKIQRDFFFTDKKKDVGYRIKSLKNIQSSIKKYEKEISEALHKDLNKSTFESYETEIGIVLEEIRHTIKMLPEWSRPKRAMTHH